MTRGTLKALIITVNFRQDLCTQRFLTSATKLEGFAQCHVLVVDNHSDDDSILTIRRATGDWPNIELLTSPQNAGYFGAARRALQHHLDTHDLPDWVLICNNDTVFEDPRFLTQLFKQDPAAAGVVAPTIVSGLTGYDENPSIRHRPSQFRMWRYQLWLSNYPMMWFKQWLAPFVRKMRHSSRAWRASSAAIGRREIYAPSGAFLIFSRRFFDEGGFIDDGSFLFAEEFRVAEICRRLQLPLIHDPDLLVWHEGSQSTGRMLTRNVFRHQQEGFRYALTRYRNSYPELSTSRCSEGAPLCSDASAPAGEIVR